jgi:hypothetical protein
MVGHRVIREAARAYATALEAQLPIDVAVLDHPPDTAAQPCVYLELEAVGWATGLWHVTHRAVVVVEAALGPAARADELGDLADGVLAAAQHVTSSNDRVRLTSTSIRVGDQPYPAVAISVTQVFTRCDLPEPPTR